MKTLAELDRTLARLDLPPEVRERMDAMTSALVTGSPLWNFSPSRKVKV